VTGFAHPAVLAGPPIDWAGLDRLLVVRPDNLGDVLLAALVQVGGDTQPEFLRFAEAELLPALREEYGKSDDARIVVR
jgi:hypothetical protein